MLIGVGRSLFVAPQQGPAYDPLAVDWAARVVTNGGAAPSAATKQAVSDFCAALRSANILSKMLAVCCLTPGGLVEALTPLIKTSGGAAYGTELVTNGGFTTNTSGWTAVNVNMSSVSGGQSGNCLQLTVIDDGDPTAYAYQQVATTAGVRYKFTAYGKIGAASNYRMTVGTTPGGTDLYDSGLCYDTGWTQKTAYFTATGSAAYISLWNPSSSANNYDTVSCQVAVLCNDPWTNYNFVSGDLTVNGLVGNGSTKYLDTGLTPTVAFSSDTSFGLTDYHVTTDSNQGRDFGITCAALIQYSNASYFDCFNEVVGQGRITASNSGWTGFLSGNRTASNSFAIYKANSGTGHTSLVTGNTSGGTRPSISVFAFAYNTSGSPSGFVGRRKSLLAIHQGLTSGESASFYNAIQALRTALGGGYV